MVQEMKELYRKNGEKELTDEEAQEAAYNLTRYAELIWDIAVRETQLKNRLKKEPQGFPIDGSYSCCICGNGINETNGWYDKYGKKCLICQKAIKENIVPTFICEHRESYFAMWALNSKFNLKAPTVKKMIRTGELKARTMLNDNGSVYYYIFLKKENPNLIERYNPVRKSYDRHREKTSKIWAKEEAKKMKAELDKRISS